MFPQLLIYSCPQQDIWKWLCHLAWHNLGLSSQKPFLQHHSYSLQILPCIVNILSNTGFFSFLNFEYWKQKVRKILELKENFVKFKELKITDITFFKWKYFFLETQHFQKPVPIFLFIWCKFKPM